ncbi:MAG: fructose-bisphosphatase class II, partial [Thermoanaerobaculia bacterium]|nr:fructose-bisphosphatase class II [Thermoanaerobaculia bacterium]
MESSTSLPSERLHVWEEGIRCLQKACEAGAREASGWIGRRNKEKADAATALAMRQVLATLPEPARVVSGEGLKDEVEHLATGEIMGLSSERLYFDLAVDPIEGTSNLANGLPWALCVAAVTPFKALFDPGPSLYMEKIVVPQPAVRHIDPNA